MKTKNESPMLSNLLYLVAAICLMGALVKFLTAFNNSRTTEVDLLYALGFGVAGVMYFAT